jgi:hypothetical protein
MGYLQSLDRPDHHLLVHFPVLSLFLARDHVLAPVDLDLLRDRASCLHPVKPEPWLSPLHGKLFGGSAQECLWEVRWATMSLSNHIQ